MRLIDADALKADLKQYFSDGVLDGVSAKVTFNQIMHDIDNAPTVITCEACKNKGNERECVDCHDYSCFVQYEPRPQGEWVAHEDGYNICPYCKNRTAFSYPFCPYCGADMRKGGAE